MLFFIVGIQRTTLQNYYKATLKNLPIKKHTLLKRNIYQRDGSF
jgi:hypothetical protein